MKIIISEKSPNSSQPSRLIPTLLSQENLKAYLGLIYLSGTWQCKAGSPSIRPASFSQLEQKEKYGTSRANRIVYQSFSFFTW